MGSTTRSPSEKTAEPIEVELPNKLLASNMNVSTRKNRKKSDAKKLNFKHLCAFSPSSKSRNFRCKASEDILQIMSKLNKTAKATREHPTLNDINRVNNHLQYIKGKFSCNGKGAFLIN